MYTRVGTVDSIGVAPPAAASGQNDPLSQIGPPPAPPKEDKSWWEYGLEALARGMQGGGGKLTPQPVVVQQPGMPSWVLPAAVIAGVAGVILYTRK